MLGSNRFTSSASVGVGAGVPDVDGADGGNGALGWPPLPAWIGPDGAGTCEGGVGSGVTAGLCPSTYCPKIRNTMPNKSRQPPSAKPGAFMGKRWLYRFTPNHMKAPRSKSSARMITSVDTGVKSPGCGHSYLSFQDKLSRAALQIARRVDGLPAWVAPSIIGL